MLISLAKEFSDISLLAQDWAETLLFKMANTGRGSASSTHM